MVATSWLLAGSKIGKGCDCQADVGQPEERGVVAEGLSARVNAEALTDLTGDRQARS